MKLVALIPTCNRPRMLNRLLRHLRREAEFYSASGEPCEVVALIADDGSEPSVAVSLTPEVNAAFRAGKGSLTYQVIARNPKPSGAKGWWRVVNQLFRAAEAHADADWIMSIQDDMMLDHGAFEQSTKLFRGLEEAGKNPIAINLLTDLDRAAIAACGSHKPVLYPEFNAWDNGWVDMCFLSRPRALEVVGWSAQAMATYKYPGRGSGVGDWYSRELRKHGTIWKSRVTFVYHGGHRSQMHPWREKTGTRIPQTEQYPYDDGGF